MPSHELTQIVGEAVFFGLLAEPFFHVGTDLLMNKEYGRAAIAYFIGSIPATLGLIVLGVISVGPISAPPIRTWISPIISDPR
jgi:hypothetical protein